MDYPFGPAPVNTDVLWRCEARRYSICIDPEAEIYGSSSPKLEMLWWKIDKRTPKGAWIAGKFVLLTARRKWACETQEEALLSFTKRKEKQINILEAQLRRAKEDLALTKEKAFA